MSETAKTNVGSVKTDDTKPVGAARSLSTVAGSRASFRKFRGCYYTYRALAAAKRSVAQCKFYEGKPQYERAYATCLNNLGDAPNRISAAEAAMAGYGNDNDVRNNYYNATKSAAKDADPTRSYAISSLIS
jgi:hypothetical protein